MHKRNQAFTLVELLIVIVVIAILAAISIVAYNGIQDRAYVSKAAATVDSYVKASQMYKTVHDEYPSTSNASGEACLSANGSLPAGDGFVEGGCVSVAPDIVIDEQLNAQLSEFISSLPAVDPIAVDVGGGVSVRGILYRPAINGAFVEYYINSSQDCPSGVQMDFSEKAKRCMITIGDPWTGTS